MGAKLTNSCIKGTTIRSVNVGLLDFFYRLLSLSPFSIWQEDPEKTYRLGQLSNILEAYVSVEGGHSLKVSTQESGRFSEGWLRGSFYSRLIGFLHRAELDDPEDPDYEIVPGRVQVMTVHQSKGLEFPAVFVIGLIEGLMPTKKGDIEEERRICFVGISRAMNLLYLSYCNSYLGQPSKRSIFLDEILGKK